MTAATPVRAVMFDLDGTLLDTAADLAEAANAMLIEAGLPTLSTSTVTSLVGRGIPNLVRRCLVTARDGQPPTEAECEAMIAAFRRHYAHTNGRHARAFPGVVEGLQAMARGGLPLACVTNKSAEFVSPLLARTQLAEYFDLVVCGDTLPHKKPHPAPLLHACAHFDVAPAAALMIGDSGNDIAAARAAGCPVFCVPYGYNEGVAVRAQDCDALIDTVLEAAQRLGLPAPAHD